MKMTLPEPSPLPIDPATIKTELWGPGRTKFTMEPMFVPRRDATAEDDGYILMLLHNGETGGTEFAILDAQRISEGAARYMFARCVLRALDPPFSEEGALDLCQ